MTLNDFFHVLCKEDIWDVNTTWNAEVPNFNRCLRHTLLTWIPCFFLILFTIFELYAIKSFKAKQSNWRLLNASRLICTVLIICCNLIEFGFYINKFINHDEYPSILFISSLLKAFTFVIFALLLIYQKSRGAPTIFIPWLFLVINLICFIPTIAQLCLHKDKLRPFEFIINVMYLCLLLVLLVLSSFADSTPKTTRSFTVLLEGEDAGEPDFENRRAPCPEDSSSFLSRLTFWWFNATAYLGYKRPLVLDDIFDLNEEVKVDKITPIFEKNWHSTDDRIDIDSKREIGSESLITNRSVIKAFFKTFWMDMIIAFFALFINSVSTLLTPVLLQYLLRFVASNDPIWHGVVITVAMFLTNAFINISFNAAFLKAYKVQVKVQGSLVNLIYKKSLRISSAAKRMSSSGEVVNLMSVDMQRIVTQIPFFFYGFTTPLLIVVSLWLLYNQLGYAAFGGLIFVVLSSPITYFSSKFAIKHQTRQMKLKDERIKYLNEMLNGIKVLKLYAWEASFMKLISNIREKEMNAKNRFQYIYSVVMLQWSFAPFAVALITFAIYSFSDSSNVLNAEKIFVTLNLIQILNLPLTMLPQIIAFSLMAYVSVKRVDKYLNSAELSGYVTRNESDVAIEVKDGCFQWESDSNEANGDCEVEVENENKTLMDINIRVKLGSLHAIVGQVGSGKSSLLSAILGEMELINGSVNIKRYLKTAYVAQQAWIENLTLRDNILFGHEYYKNKFDEIIDLCALRQDLEILPAGDLTEIGEKGINLSGGQKQRVSLARACYSEADLYLFDDPLSAVDTHVAKHLFDYILSPKKGLLKNKTRVLVTNRLDILPKVDYITVVKDGKISEQGTYEDLMKSNNYFADFVNQFSVGRQASFDRQVSVQSGVSDGVEEKKDVIEKDTLVEDETAEVGDVKLSVYKEYVKAVSVFWSIFVIAGIGGYQFLAVSGNYWLSKWSGGAESDRNFLFGIYGLIGALQAIVVTLGNFSIIRGSYHSSIKLHKKLLNRVLRSPLSFFETTPLGRILNRFSKDMDSVDMQLPWDVLFRLFEVIFSLVVVAMQTGVFVFVLAPVFILYYIIQRLYLPTSRQLQRLQSITVSPIYAHFSQTLQGLSTIRAFNATERFIHESNHRLELNLICFYALNVAYAWLGIFLNTFGSFVVLFVCLYATFQRDSLSAGMVGLSLMYAISLTWSTLYWLVRSSTVVETNIVSVERINEYCRNEVEDEWIIETNRPPITWPDKGVIKFDKYATRYRAGLDLVLNDITASINSREKIGIVGRTGAGKSTITLSLFRIIEAVKGKIVIDNCDISKLGLHDLRSKLTIIPQDPVLFSGTLRFNLDPFDTYTDDQIWEALKNSHLKSFVSGLEKGLSHEISEGGENLSVGQRQLVCVARALLRKSKILVLDEATASVDLETDSLIQQTIKSEFSDCTILTIAHRIQTIIDCDRIMVIDMGIVTEFDTPKSLLSNENSMFYSLAKNAGIVS